MSIITISRGSYSKGKDVAEALAEKLGYICTSREVLLEAANEFNVPESKIAKILHDPPTMLDRFYYDRERYLRYFQSALLSHVSRDNVVYHGLAGHFFLEDIPHVLKVRIIASKGSRIKEEMTREGGTQEEARDRLKHDDEERQKWNLRIYGKDAWDSRLYDLVLNLDRLSINEAADMLVHMARMPQFQTTSESAQLLEKKTLLAKVQARVAKHSPKITVSLIDDGIIALDNLGGGLKTDQYTRQKFTENLIRDLHIKDVVFQKKTVAPKAYINTFYNLNLS
ncbi:MULTISPECIES: AAA family ATPase [Desulfosediminicola]|uniref:cytidylate kinase-like family protein n=1 Tax=Desulfosediminicola TaxID=2886823 RepID=UPI0010ABBD8E|nr:cytidylate kinase-like family protein [Desulfosediminicola ganghwensis]